MCDRKWVLTVYLEVNIRLMKLQENLRCHLSKVHNFTVAAFLLQMKSVLLLHLTASRLYEATPKDSFPNIVMASPQIFSQIFTTNSAFSSFFFSRSFWVFLFFIVLRGSNSKPVPLWQRNPSSVYVQPTFNSAG